MVKIPGVLLMVLVGWNQAVGQNAGYNAVVREYILQYKGIAVNEMKVYRIPASITLAQGILESNAGRSDLAVKANNHFGIKCHKGWTGKTFYQDDDARDECFRRYESPLESFRDHSAFLAGRDRYKNLFNLDITDYKGWATGLKSAGYATNPAYAEKLVSIIENFSLDRYDKTDYIAVHGDSMEAPGKTGRQEYIKSIELVSVGPGNRGIYENNHLRMIIAGSDDNIYTIAGDFNMTVEKLMKYNDLSLATALNPGQMVYLEKKRRNGIPEFHRVGEGETLYDLSQLYGIRLKALSAKNHLKRGGEPRTGSILRLR